MYGDLAVFVARFLRHPLRVGAVAPSSVTLAARVVAPVPGCGDPVVVELGPGTGVFTRAIQDRLAGRGYHLAVEADPVFAAMLRRRYRGVDVVFDDAVHLPALLASRGLPAADVVISGLPWTVFPGPRAADTLARVASVMAPHAALTTFAYIHALWTPPARRLRQDLRWTFDELVVGRTVWPNLPPALVYHARRPHPAPRPLRASGPLGGGRTERAELVVDEAEAVRQDPGLDPVADTQLVQQRHDVRFHGGHADV
jgi:phospholipid N-methyltransferase